MENPETPFIISTASCGSADTRIVTARNIIDVKRALLFEQWGPNAEYFYEKLGLPIPTETWAGHPMIGRSQRMFAVLVGVCSGKESFWDLKPSDIGKLNILQPLDSKALLAVLPDDIIEKLFDFAFTGGEGEQQGNPGKEWTTITVEPLVIKSFPSIYQTYDAAKILSKGDQIRYQQKAGFLSSEDDDPISDGSSDSRDPDESE